jgi:gliding motility-associated-like protein
MRKKFLRFIFCMLPALMIIPVAVSAQDAWQEKSAFGGSARKGSVACVIGTKAYTGTGFDGIYRRDLWEWDQATDSWTQLADLPGLGRAYATGFATTDKVVITTGYNGGFLGDTWVYDPVTDLWTAGAAFPGGARQGCAGVVIGDKGFVGLGFDGAFKNDFYEYNHTTNTWINRASYPGISRIYATAFCIGSTAYVGTGYNGVYLNDFYAYDRSTDTWAAIRNLDGAIRGGAVSFALNGKGYVGLGDDGSNLRRDLWEYDPQANLWSQKSSLPALPREHASAFTIGNRGYILCGSDNGVGYYNDMWEWRDDYCTLTVTANIEQVSCQGGNDGSISLTANGGVEPLVYTWNMGDNTSAITGLAPGSYSVTVRDAENCKFYHTFIIAQPPAIVLGRDTTYWQQARRGGGTGNDIGHCIAADETGNLYIGGTFTGTAVFGSTTLTSLGGEDIFIAKYNSLGNLQWVQQIGGTLNDEIKGIGLDSIGNIYIAGSYRILAFFGGQQFNASGESDIFLARYSNAGTLAWVQSSGGFFEDKALGLTVDRAGNCYVTGYFQGISTFQGNTLISSGGEDAFAACYNSAGVLEWINQGGGASPVRGTAIARSITGDVIATGLYQGSVNFGGIPISSAGDNDIFIVRYNRYGQIQSLQSAGGTGDDRPYAILSDEQDNLYLSGYFSGTATIGGQPLVSAGAKDAFVAKLDPSGNALFAVRSGGNGDDVATGIRRNRLGHCLVSGFFSNTASFGAYNLTSAGGTDIFLARLDPSGQFRMATRTGGSGNDQALALTIDHNQNPVFTGSFLNSFFISGITLTSAGGTDMLFARLRESTYNVPPAVTPVTCEGGSDGAIELVVAGGTPGYTYAWSNGSTTQNLSGIGTGTYLLTITDAENCTKDTTFVVTSTYVLPQPPVSASVNRENFCADDPGNITLTAVGGSGEFLEWYTVGCGGTPVGSGTSIVIPSPEITTTYYARWENPCGLTTCTEVTVTVLPLPVPPTSITANQTTFCAGTGSLVMTATGGSGEVFRWYAGDCGGTLVATGNPVTLTPPSTNTTYYGRWESTCGQSACLSVSITSLPLAEPVTGVSASQATICYNHTGNITLTATGGSGNTLKWGLTCHGPAINQGASIMVNPPATTTTYYVWWENSCGPSACDSVTVTVLPAPQAPLSISISEPAYCLGAFSTITLTATGGSGDYVKWFEGYCGSLTVAGIGNPITIPAPSVNKVYYARWETTCGFSPCSPGASLTVYPLPVASFTGLNASYCEDALPVTLTGNFAPAGIFTGSGITDNGNGTATFNPASAGPGGPYTITYAYTDPNGCFDDYSQTVVVRALPYVNYAGLAANYCLNASPVPLTGNLAPFGSFSGPGITASINGVGTFSPAVAGVGGPYNIVYSYTDIYGCSNSNTQSTQVSALPVVNFSGLLNAYCVNDPPATLVGNQAPEGFFSGAGIVNIGFGQAIFDPALAGVGGPYNITYTYTDPNGCTNASSQTTVVSALPEVNFSGLLGSYCSNSPVSILIGNNAPGGSFTGPGITSNPNGTATFDPAVAGPGVHSITYTFTNATGCTNSYTQSTNVLPAPSVNFSGLNPAYCPNSPNALLSGNFAPFGTFTGTGVTDNLNGTATFKPAVAGVGGPYNITYTYQALNGCTNTNTQQTSVNPLPSVSFTGLALSYCLNASPAPLTGNPQPGTFGGPGITDNGNGTGAFDPSVAGVGTHTIWYFYTDGNACTDTMFKQVAVNALPQPTIIDILPQYCVNAIQDTITGSFFPLGNFTGPGITDLGIGLAIFNPAAAGAGGPYEIIYTYTDFNGCTEDTTYQVTVLPKPVVDFNPFATTYCIDATPATLVGNHPPFGSFTGPGVTDQGNGTALFDPAAAGAGLKNVTYSFTDLNGCTNDTTKTTRVIPLPVKPAVVTISNNNFCTGSLTEIYLGVAGGSGDTVEVFQSSCGGTLLGMFEPPTLFPITAPTDTTTYYARWINTCGESDCDSIRVNVVQMPMPPVPEVDTNNFCAGTVNIITLTATGGVGGYNSTLKWWKNSCGQTLVGIGQPLIITAPVDTTTYWVTYQNACGMSACDSIQVNVTPQPIAPVALTVDTNFYCIGTVSQIILEAAGGLGDTLYWYQDECGNTPIGFGSPFTLTAPDTTTTYFARWVNKCNQTECISITVEVVQLPEPPTTVEVDQNDFCAGVVGIIQLSASGGSGNTLQWFRGSCGGTFIGTGSPILTNAPVDTTTYYARWINQCAESVCDSVIVNVRPQPRPLDSLQVDPEVFCADYAGIITLTAFGIFETGDTVQWYQDACGQNYLGTGLTLTVPAPDTTTVYYASNANSCGESYCVSVQAIVNTPLPPSYLAADTTFICFDYPGTITLTAFGGHGDNLVWFADSCNGTPIASGTLVSIPAPDTTTVYFARWENECGESDCMPITIHVIEIPRPPDTIAVDTNYYCYGAVDYITLTAIGGYGDTISSLGERIRWFRKSCGSTTLGTGPTLTIPAPVISTWYYARWENHCGESACDSFQVVVHTARRPDSITADTNNYCPGAVTALTLEAWGGYGDQLVWRRVLDGDTIPIGQGTPLNIVAPQVTTKYLARWQTYCGPSAWREFTVKVNQPFAPATLYASNDTLCSDDPGPIELWAEGGNGDTLRWYSGACLGTEIGTGLTLVVPTPAETTTYFARWENVCGVSDCASVSIVIVPAPTVFAGPLDSICEGNTYSIQNATATDYSSLLWTTKGPGSFSNPSAINPVYDPGNINIEKPTVVYLKLSVNGNAPCGTYADSIQLTINPKPVLYLTPPAPAICRDSVIMLTASGAHDYKWLPNQSLDTARGAMVHAFPQTTSDYQVVGISRSGCRDTLGFEIVVKPTPFVDLGEDLYLFSCEPVVLDAGGGDGSESYEWQDGSMRRTFTASENGTYWVRVFNDGCANIDTIEVQLCEGYIHAPSAFTPNNDGLNDVFRIISSDLTIDFRLYIFDRHGQMIFETDDIDQGWDGTVKGSPAPPDVYVYMIKFRGKGSAAPGVEIVRKGQVVLVR